MEIKATSRVNNFPSKPLLIAIATQIQRMEDAAPQPHTMEAIAQKVDMDALYRKHASCMSRVHLKFQRVEANLLKEIAELREVIKDQGEAIAAQASVIEDHEASIATLRRYLPCKICCHTYSLWK
jgi:hypothetical protein